MRRQRFIRGVMAAVILTGMTSPAMADMESMTDDQMGTVQGLSGTIVSSHPVLPRPALSADSPGSTIPTAGSPAKPPSKFFLQARWTKTFTRVQAIRTYCFPSMWMWTA
jgi:hypothetical protein